MNNPILYKKLNKFLHNLKIEDDNIRSEVTDMVEELLEEIESLEGSISGNENRLEEVEEDRDTWKNKFQDLEYEYNELIK